MNEVYTNGKKLIVTFPGIDTRPTADIDLLRSKIMEITGASDVLLVPGGVVFSVIN